MTPLRQRKTNPEIIMNSIAPVAVPRKDDRKDESSNKDLEPYED